MLPSANTLMASGTALVFKDMAQLQAAAAQMEIESLNLIKDLLNIEPQMMQCGLDAANAQAAKQIQLGWVEFGQGLGQAAITLGISGLGVLRNPAPGETPQMETTLSEMSAEEEEVAVLTGEKSIPMSDIASLEDEGGAAKVVGEQKAPAPSNPATSTTANTSDESTEAQKALAKEQEKVQSQRNLYSSVFAPQAASVLSGGFNAWKGYVQSGATKDQAATQLSQGVLQTVNQVQSQTGANIQAKEQQEQAALQAFLTVEQLSGSRA